MTRAVPSSTAVLAALPLSAVALLAACTGGSVPEGSGSSPLGATLRVEPEPVTAGGTMRLALEVTNRADTAVSLDFATGQRFDFAVRRDGDELARWSSGMMFTQALGTETYASGETRSLAADMDAPSQPGEYTVVGWITSRDLMVRDSVPVTAR